MPVTVEIDGLGKVELDDAFRDKSPAEQEAIIADIVAQASGSGGGGSVARDRGARETYAVLERIVSQLYPHAKFTSDKRSPEHNRAVGGVEGSYHVSGHGIDVVGLTAQERADLKSQLEGMGIGLDEYKYHTVQKDGGGWHLHIGSTHVPDELFDPEPQPDDVPESSPQAAAPSASPRRAEKPEVRTGGEEDEGLTWDQFGNGLAKGLGNVVEGIADVPGIVVDPLATYLGKAMGYSGNADFGKTVRESLGLPADETLTGDIIRGASGGLSGAALSRLLAKAGTGVVANGFKEMGSTPIRDAVGGASAAASSGIAEELGAPAPVQALAGLAGGVLGHSAGAIPKAVSPDARATRFATKQASQNPSAAYDAEIVQDLAKARATLDRAKSDPKARAPLDVKVINDVQDSYTDQTMQLVRKLGLPKMEELRLQNALSRKHSLPQEEIDALRGTVAGDAVADAVVKTQRLRRLTPEIARNKSLLTRTGEVASTAMDLIPGIPGVTGRAVRWATKAAAGDAEAARVHAAQRLLDKQRGYAKLQEMVGPSGQRESREALWDAASTVENAKAAAAQAKRDAQIQAALERQQAKAAAQKLRTDNQRVGVKNDLDDIKPGGGFRGMIYDRIGLLPSQQDAGALTMLKDGKITPEQFDAFLASPDKLMKGNAGNAISDRLAAMADEGKLSRDPAWTKPEPAPAAPAAPMVDANGEPIRSWPAYQGGIVKNSLRELDLLKQLDEIDPVQGSLADGAPVRASEAGLLKPEEMARADALRAQIAALKPKPKN